VQDKMGIEGYQWVASSHCLTNDRHRVTDMSSRCHRYGVTERAQASSFEE